MRVLIIDDEPLARARLRRLLLSHPDYLCVGEAENAAQALTMIAELTPDLLLLDIAMPDGNGISLASKVLTLTTPPAVIFVTAHPEHALEAYQAAPADYLLKPVSAERLSAALQRLGATTRAHLERKQVADKLSYTLAGVTRQLAVRDILYCVADDKYVRVILTNGDALLDVSLNQLEQQFSQQLLRIHRKILINKYYFDALHASADGKHYLTLRQLNDKLDVSRRALPAIKAALQLK